MIETESSPISSPFTYTAIQLSTQISIVKSPSATAASVAEDVSVESLLEPQAAATRESVSREINRRRIGCSLSLWPDHLSSGFNEHGRKNQREQEVPGRTLCLRGPVPPGMCRFALVE